MSTLIHVGQQSLISYSVMGKRMNASQTKSKYSTLLSQQVVSTQPTEVLNHHFDSPRNRLFTLGSLQTVTRVQNVDRIYTLNKFTLLIRIKAFSAALGEDFTTLRLETRRQDLNKYRLEIDTANWHDKHGTRSTNKNTITPQGEHHIWKVFNLYLLPI